MPTAFKDVFRTAGIVLFALSLACHANEPCFNHTKDPGESDVDCGGTCASCGPGRACVSTADCPTQFACNRGICGEANCGDQLKDQDETDVDCGGVCGGCGADKSCLVAADCESQVCTSGRCAGGTCADSLKDQGESDVDCGGTSPCARCANGGQCEVGNDCLSNLCGGFGVCMEFDCTNRLQDSDESDIDCGGTHGCARCVDSKHCNTREDCSTNACVDHTCRTVDLCNNHEVDQEESDVDCGGGGCAACQTGQHCIVAASCVTNRCEDGTCLPATCHDNTLNQGEGDTDCGGPCGPCPNNAHCNANADCLGAFCATVDFMQVCSTASCDDFAQDGAETDIDCGGGCPLACGYTRGCLVAEDCLDHVCGADHTCAQATCSDHVTNGNESDVDCGETCTSKCGVGRTCNTGADCQSSYCNPTTHLCANPTCTDHLLNGRETAVDCGGPTCPACANSLTCTTHSECQSNYCGIGLLCADASCTDHMRNGFEAGVDCGGPCPTKCALGTACSAHSDCESGTCNGTCRAPSCSNHFQDSSETDRDCGGSCAAKCAENQGCLATSDCTTGLVCSRHVCSLAQCGNGLKEGNEVGIDCGGPCLPCGPDSLSVSCSVGDDCISGYCENGACATQDILFSFTFPADNGAVANTADLFVQFNQPVLRESMVACTGNNAPVGCNVKLQDASGYFVPIWIAPGWPTPPLTDGFYIGHPVLLDIVHMTGDYKLTVIGGETGPHGAAGGIAPGDLIIGFRCSSG